MTFKIIQGLVGGATTAAHEARAPAQDGKPASQAATAPAAQKLASEAVVTTVFSATVRKTSSVERLPSYDKAKEYARSVAKTIREKTGEDAHQGLSEVGISGAARQHFV